MNRELRIFFFSSFHKSNFLSNPSDSAHMLAELTPKKPSWQKCVVCGAAVVMQNMYLTAVPRMKAVTIQNSKDEKLILVCTSGYVYSVFTVIIPVGF